MTSDLDLRELVRAKLNLDVLDHENKYREARRNGDKNQETFHILQRDRYSLLATSLRGGPSYEDEEDDAEFDRRLDAEYDAKMKEIKRQRKRDKKRYKSKPTKEQKKLFHIAFRLDDNKRPGDGVYCHPWIKMKKVTAAEEGIDWKELCSRVQDPQERMDINKVLIEEYGKAVCPDCFDIYLRKKEKRGW